MKITIESCIGEPEEKVVSVTLPEESDIFNVMEAIYGLLITVTYSYKSVLNGCSHLLEEFGDTEA